MRCSIALVVERLEERPQLAPVDRAARPAQLDRQAPDALDEAEEVLALLLGDDLSEERAEELDLARERVARARRADARGLGSDGGVEGGPRRSAAGRVGGHPSRLAGGPSRGTSSRPGRA